MQYVRRPRAVPVVILAVALAVVALVAYGCVWYANITRYSTDAGRVTVHAGHIEGFGAVLVTDKGYALYMFPPDHRRRVSCTGDCVSSWPPLVVPPGDSVSAGPGVRSGLLGVVRGADGRRVVSYRGWPLYTFAADVRPKHANGQGIVANGGPWYVLRPSGQVVRS